MEVFEGPLLLHFCIEGSWGLGLGRRELVHESSIRSKAWPNNMICYLARIYILIQYDLQV